MAPRIAAPSVSVVIPTRDRPHLLATTLRSVLWQRDVDHELIIVDDGSTVPVSEMGNIAARIVRHDESLGVARARNHGIDVARGRWIAFLDDDDLWAPEKLLNQLRRAEQTGASWVYSGAVAVDEDLNVFDGDPPAAPEEVVAELRGYNSVPAPVSNVMVRADFLGDVGGFDDGFMHVADWDLVLRLADAGLPACVATPDVAYRWHGGNASLRIAEMLAEVERFERTRGLRTQRGVFRRYAGTLEQRAGHRLHAAGHFARAALLHRDMGLRGARRDLKAAVVALIGGIRTGRRGRPAPEDESAAYRRGAEEWIARLRT